MSGSRAITCPNCGGTLEVRAAGFSVNLACRRCGSLLDVSRAEVALIKSYKRASRSFCLTIGARGSLFGQEWEIVGALRQRDEGVMPRREEFALRQEFLLFNPYLGYRWLIVEDEQWQFGTPLADRPQINGHSVYWRGERFGKIGEEQATTIVGVAGEFYWRAARRERARQTLFGSGAQILCREITTSEENWTQLVPLSASDIPDAFGEIPKKVPSMRKRDAFLMMGIAAAVAFFAALAMELIAGPVNQAGGQVLVPVGGQIEAVKLGTITVERPWQFVAINASASQFENRWVDLEYSLVNRANEQAVEASGVLEHYTGRDSSGAWSEGSGQNDVLLGQVPRGTYDLYVSGSAHGWPEDPAPNNPWATPETIRVAVWAETGKVSWGMWWTLVIAMFAVPLVILGRRYEE